MSATSTVEGHPAARASGQARRGWSDGMDVFGQSWKGRQVAVVGLGRSGVAAATLLHRMGSRVRATDATDTEPLRATRDALHALGVVDVEIGHHTRRFMESAEAVVVSPGVHESVGPVQWALERGVPILSEIELAFRFCPSPIVAVTGTNGKSSVVTLMAELLRVSGRRSIACGNLGIPFSSLIDQLTSEVVAVVEVSSFQLLWCQQFRPRIGVFLNLGTNHLDRHQDHGAYVAAKARLFQAQTPEDWAVLNGRDPRIVELGERLHACRVWFGDNRSNPPQFMLTPETRQALTDSAQAVLQVGRLLGIPDPLSWQVLRSFRGLEHRLEHVAIIRGIRFVNDSKSTTPDSTLFALAQTHGDVVMILGGRDKGLDFESLVGALRTERVKGVVLIGESQARLGALFNGHPNIKTSGTLEDAIQTAAGLSGPGTTILFSPACASFDMFRDFEARGCAFKRIVRRLASGQ